LNDVYQAVGPELDLTLLRKAIETHASDIAGTPQGRAREEAIEHFIELARPIVAFLKDAQS
jgi:hypothetical protein